MFAYSFQPRFREPILAGVKNQTIRAVGRKRHARPGERLQLYTGLRTRYSRLVGQAECIGVDLVQIDFPDFRVVLTHPEGKAEPIVIDTASGLNAFARRDGFRDQFPDEGETTTAWEDMRSFWRAHHPGIERFEGLLIEWRDFEAAE